MHNIKSYPPQSKKDSWRKLFVDKNAFIFPKLGQVCTILSSHIILITSSNRSVSCYLSGKTKVILPLLCQTFLSNNSGESRYFIVSALNPTIFCSHVILSYKDAHEYFARGGECKDTLIILVPEHLVNDARTQVFRHCLNVNYRQEYRVYDDIFALLHKNVKLGDGVDRRSTKKQIFVTSFNQVRRILSLTIFHIFLYRTHSFMRIHISSKKL